MNFGVQHDTCHICGIMHAPLVFLPDLYYFLNSMFGKILQHLVNKKRKRDNGKKAWEKMG